MVGGKLLQCYKRVLHNYITTISGNLIGTLICKTPINDSNSSTVTQCCGCKDIAIKIIATQCEKQISGSDAAAVGHDSATARACED